MVLPVGLGVAVRKLTPPSTVYSQLESAPEAMPPDPAQTPGDPPLGCAGPRAVAGVAAASIAPYALSADAADGAPMPPATPPADDAGHHRAVMVRALADGLVGAYRAGDTRAALLALATLRVLVDDAAQAQSWGR